MIARILFAFLWRDVRIQLSYRVEFVLNLLSILFAVGTFYFVSKLIGAAPLPDLAAYGGAYFPFVLIGVAFSTYQGVGLRSLAQSIRQEQYLGTLEPVLSSPVRLPLFLFASAQWDFLYSTFEVGVYLAVGILVFGARYPHANLASAFVMLALTLSSFLSIGVMSAAFILRYKRGDPVAWIVGTASELLGGVYFPISVLPPWLKAASLLVPMTHALEGLRRAALKGDSLWEVRGPAMSLAAFTALVMPLGIWLFRRSLDAARRDGSLGHY
ncbi:MAG: ABC transporter permease [Elusimicrobia bacterium]|nr:ABC transporter permease [Elusimicrobiota bacterium]